jgi:hypothetical protein
VDTADWGRLRLLWLTTRRTQIHARAIVVPYLLTTIMFIAHVCEEYTTYAQGLPSFTPLRATLGARNRSTQSHSMANPVKSTSTPTK